MSWGFIRESIIKKTPGKQEWCVESESGKNMGCSDSYAGAAKRLGEVEWFKEHKKKGAADCPIGVDHIHEDLREFKEIDEHLTDAKKVVKNMVSEDKQALKHTAMRPTVWGYEISKSDNGEVTLFIQYKEIPEPEWYETFPSVEALLQKFPMPQKYMDQLAALDTKHYMRVPAPYGTVEANRIVASITQKINQQDYTFDFVPVHDLDSGTITEYIASPREMPYQQVRIPNPEGKPLSENLLASWLYDLLAQPEVFAKFASDLGTHGDGNSDSSIYPDNGNNVDRSVGERVEKTFEDRTVNAPGGAGIDDERKHNDTTLTNEVMERQPRVDFRDPKQPSSNASGEFYDNTNKVDAPKEGEILGLQPSYSAADLYVAITPRQTAWGFAKESLFDQFIGNVGEILAACKASGASRAAAREAAIKVHSSLFAKHEWMSPILDRFLDRAYGTTAKVQSSLSTLEGCISDFVVTAHKNGWPKPKTLQASVTEFSSWIENYPETQTLIENRIDATYGVSPEVIAPFIEKQAANEYAVQLSKSFKKFPLPYAEFRKWCSVQQVTVPTLYALERIAVELNYVTMPETLVVFSEKDVYMSDDKQKTIVQERPADPNLQSNEQVLPDGTKVTRMKKITE